MAVNLGALALMSFRQAALELIVLMVPEPPQHGQVLSCGARFSREMENSTADHRSGSEMLAFWTRRIPFQIEPWSRLKNRPISG
jgi:hypothetical protein